MPEPLLEWARHLHLAFVYAVVFGLFWATVWGAARLSVAARREAAEDAGELLREVPGRCYVAGIGFLILGWLLAALAKKLGPLGVLLLLWWLRHVFRGLVAWLLVRGEQLREAFAEEPGGAADALHAGLRSTALASALPFLGWAVLFMAALQGAGAESLRGMGRGGSAADDPEVRAADTA